MKIKMYLYLVLVAILLLVAACGSTEESDSSNGNEKEKLIVQTFGGDYMDLLEKYVVPETDNLDVEFAPTDTETLMTKLRTEKDSDSGSYDVVVAADLNMQRLIDMDLLQEIDFSKLENGDELVPGLANDYSVPHIYSGAVLIYNTDEIDSPPKTWDELWDSKYKGRIGIFGDMPEFWAFAAASKEGLITSDNWDDVDWDAAWEEFENLMPNEPIVYSSQEDIGQAMKKGDIWLTISHKARAIHWNDGSGAPLDYVIPKEGALATQYGFGIPKNSKNVDGAYNFLTAVIDPNAQGGFAKEMGYSPTINNAVGNEDVADTINFTPEEQELIVTPDSKFLSQHRAEWMDLLKRITSK